MNVDYLPYCVRPCESGYYYEPVSDACTPCKEGCDYCSSADSCTICSSGYFFFYDSEERIGSCHKTCPLGSYADWSTFNCNDCRSSCAICSSNSNCFLCKDGFVSVMKDVSTNASLTSSVSISSGF